MKLAIRLVSLVSVFLLTSVGLAAATAADTPAGADQVGAWTAPFEEGGAQTPRCVTGTDGREVCKPVGLFQVALEDGRVLYINGIESSENIDYNSVTELSPESRDSQSRILDLRGGTPAFSTPVNQTGGATNPNIQPGDTCQPGPDSIYGILGVPGRPGDGLAGSVAGQLGVPAQNPTCAPDDVQANDADFFCADVAQLPDGRLLVVGGTDWYNEPSLLEKAKGDPYDVGIVELEGLRSSRIFNPVTNAWTVTPPMKYGRWYPGEVTMPDGKVFVASGVTKLIKSTQGSQVRRTETYDPVTNSWSENYTGPASENTLPLMPRLHLMPNGKVFYGGAGQTWGPFGQAADEALFGLQQFWNDQTKEWEVVGPAPLGARGGAFQIMLPMSPPYTSATLLTFGGTLGPPPGGYLATPFSTLTTVDQAGNVANSLTGNLNHARWFASGVALPDGQVLALNGADKDEVIVPGLEVAVRTPELYNPATGAWTDVAIPERDRTYHNSAILLPDGRVLSGGHSPIAAAYGAHHDVIPGVTANNDKDPSFEVWSPPYLFRGPRPSITYAPTGVAWGSQFPIVTPDAANIDSVVLMRMPSAQHVIDSDTRTLVLNTVRMGSTLVADAPPNGVVAPPGTYYLFVNKKSPKGPIPSVARIVTVGGQGNSRQAYQPFASQAAAPSGGSATPVFDSSYVAQPPPVPPRSQAPAVAAVDPEVARSVWHRVFTLLAVPN